MLETYTSPSIEEPAAPPPPPMAVAPMVFALVGLVAAAVLAGLAITLLIDRGESGDGLLVVDDQGTVQLLDPSTGEQIYSLDDAVVAPDRSSLFTATARTGGTTDIESRDPQTGLATGLTNVPGVVEIRTVSPRAGAIALMEPRPAGLGLYEPVPRETTTVTVAYTNERPAQVFELEGNYEPETFSSDEETLYLLQFHPPSDPEWYFVRELDLATGEVVRVSSPQVDLRPEMRGVARAQVISPEGDAAFTLYTLPGDQPVHDLEAANDTERWAFVHVLDLEQGYDFCLFLPQPMGQVNEATMGIGLSPDGSTLWVADPAAALMARLDTESLTVEEVIEVPEIADPTQRAHVAVADDGTVYVAVGARIHEFEASTHLLTAAWQSQGETGWARTVDELTMSDNSAVLMYSAEGTIVLIDRTTGAELATLTGPEGEGLQILGPPTGRAAQIPLSCAC